MPFHDTCLPRNVRPLLIAVLLAVGLLEAGVATDAVGVAPAVTILTPHDGWRANPVQLRVQALVTMPDRLLRVDRVDLVVDDVAVQSLATAALGARFVADFALDVSGSDAGLRTVRVIAYAQNRQRAQGSAQVQVEIDRALTAPWPNRVEAAATPDPFAVFSASIIHRGGSSRPQIVVEGKLRLGAMSDGLDPTRDRIVLTLGTTIASIEPEQLTCSSGPKCSFKNLNHPGVTRLSFEQAPSGNIGFIAYVDAPASGEDRFALRIGNDWGAVDLASGARAPQLALDLDTARQSQVLIGPEGGTVETIDAQGVRITLAIPPGALPSSTAITMSPLATPPLPGDTLSIPGVHFEPEGLVFAQPATLTFHLGAAGIPVLDSDVVLLVTSPLTAVPLAAVRNPAEGTLSATLWHFSTVGPAPSSANFSDLARWANQTLATGNNLTLQELQSLAEIAAIQQQLGCTTGCVDMAVLASRAQASIDALVVSQCANDIGDSTDAGLQRYIDLEVIAQQMGIVVPAVRQCMQQVLHAMIDRANLAAIAQPGYDTTFPRLLELASRAQQLSFPSLQTLALQHVESAMRTIAIRMSSEVSDARGTSNEASEVQEARDGFQQALDYLQGPGAAVLAVAPTLDDDMQAALNGLTSAGGFTLQTHVHLLVWNVFHDSQGNVVVQGSQHVNGLRSAQGSAPGSSLSLAVFEVGNTVAIETGFSYVPSQGSRAEGEVDLEFTFSRPGRLSVLWAPISPEWGGASLGVSNGSGPAGSWNFEEPGACYMPVTGPCSASLRVGAGARLNMRFGFDAVHAGGVQAAIPVRFIFTPGDASGDNRAPTAVNTSHTTDVDQALSIELLASDLDGDPLIFEVTTQPAHGRVIVSGSQAAYIPDPGFSGRDEFTYTVSDGHGGSSTATVRIRVGPEGGGS